MVRQFDEGKYFLSNAYILKKVNGTVVKEKLEVEMIR